MKLVVIFVLCLVMLSCAVNRNLQQELRVMTFNIRYNNPGDNLNNWSFRKDMVASMIRFHKADIIGVQEALYDQMQDLEKLLPGYSWIGVGRDDGITQGEFSAIFFLKDRLTVLENSTFWLSETPGQPGLGWDAACVRIVTWGKFLDKKTGKLFYQFNTHFDHQGEIARRESAGLLLASISEIAGKNAVIVTGDFNASQDSEPYQILTQGSSEKNEVQLFDSETISLQPHHGPSGSFTGFDFSKLTGKMQQIDYIFVTDKIRVIRHGTLSDTFNGVLPSDHLPVLSEMYFLE